MHYHDYFRVLRMGFRIPYKIRHFIISAAVCESTCRVNKHAALDIVIILNADRPFASLIT